MGLRGQAGEINARSEFFGTAILNGFPLSPDPGPPVEISSDFVRLTTYLYDHWQFSPSWLAVAGVTLDHLRSPINHRFAPLTRGEESANQVSPKLGLVWTPTHRTTARAALSRSLGGVGFDQSFQLEPSQVAGFNQAFRSIIPESVANANAGAEFRMAALSLDHQLSSNTWAGISFSWLTSDLDRTVGIFDNDNPLIPLSTRQHIEYQERSLTAYLYQLIDQQWSVGLRYRLSDADIQLSHLDLRASAFSTSAFPATSTQALLHQTTLFTQFQHPGGFFARGEATWYRQQNQDYRPAIPGDDFWQFNLYAGYRFPKRRAEIQLGILNLTSQDYRLNSLNLSEVLPRERTFAASLKFNF